MSPMHPIHMIIASALILAGIVFAGYKIEHHLSADIITGMDKIDAIMEQQKR